MSNSKEITVESREIGTHFATNCNGKVIYYWSRSFAYRECKGCGDTPGPRTREEARRGEVPPDVDGPHYSVNDLKKHAKDGG